MSARTIAQALGAARKEGRGWRCRCPLHGGVSLTLRDGGRLLVWCWGGCNGRDVFAAMCLLGLLERHNSDYQPTITMVTRRYDSARNAARTARALALWRKGRPFAGSLAETYLRARGIALGAWPPTLRFHPRCPHPNGVDLPAMAALVEHVKYGSMAVHATYLRADGSGKAAIAKPKAMFGPVGGGAVRLGMPCAGKWLAIAEGIETALAVATACPLPAWAALSAGGIRALALPREATHVLICADHDASGTGQRAAQDAAQRWLAEGRHVRIALPPEPGTDMADALVTDMAADTMEARRVA